jgi:hypothetical protein
MRYSLRKDSNISAFLNISAYIPSDGTNIIAKSVVVGGLIYLDVIVFAVFLTDSSNLFRKTASASLDSPAS